MTQRNLLAAIARTDAMLLEVAATHTALSFHDTYLTSGEGWFCPTCEHDLGLEPSIPVESHD